MPPAVNNDFSLAEAIEWLKRITKAASLPGVKPARNDATSSAKVTQTFTFNQTAGPKYKHYRTLSRSQVVMFEMTPGWAALPRTVIGQHIFQHADGRIQVTINHFISNDEYPNETFEFIVVVLPSN